MHLTVDVARLPLRHTFRIAHGVLDVQDNVIVALAQEGCTGYGESSSVSYYAQGSADAVVAALERARPVVEELVLTEPGEIWPSLREAVGGNPFALCALDQAAHDLWGKLRGEPVWKLWGLSLDDVPPSDYTIGIAPIPEMVRKLAEFPGFPVYKVKLGTDDDLAIVEALRAHLGSDGAALRIDANCAWTAERTHDLAPRLAELGVEFLEQPLAADDIGGMRRLRELGCALPVVADESCQVESDVAACAGLFDGVNVKLTKCGGLTPARRMIADARARGLSVMVGCMTESTVGISATAQLLPLLDYADLDGALLLAADVADGVRVEQGRVVFPDMPGTGVTWRGLP